MKKDFRVFKVGFGGFFNVFFFFFIGVILKRFVMVRKKGGISIFGECSILESCMLCLGRMNCF